MLITILIWFAIAALIALAIWADRKVARRPHDHIWRCDICHDIKIEKVNHGPRRR